MEYIPTITNLFAIAFLPMLIYCLVVKRKLSTDCADKDYFITEINELRKINQDLQQEPNNMSGTDCKAASEEVASTIKRAYDKADHIIEASSKDLIDFEKNIKKNTEVTLEMVKNIDEVHSKIGTLKTSLSQLSRSSEGLTQLDNKLEEIHTCIKSITDKSTQIIDIAFQAKLLSFNASVEASRAGEQGKGFAVVATEMGNLANSTQNSSEEISKSVTFSNQVLKSIKEEILNQVSSLKATLEHFNIAFEEAQNRVTGLYDFSNELKTFTNALNENVKSFSSNNKTGLESLTSYLSDCIGAVTNTRVTNISPQEAYNELSSFTIIDVRRPEEFNDDLGHIENATLMTLQDHIESKLQKLDPNKKYLFVCRSGGRSVKGARIALTNQFKQVYNLDGGMLNWKKANLKSVGINGN